MKWANQNQLIDQKEDKVLTDSSRPMRLEILLNLIFKKLTF